MKKSVICKGLYDASLQKAEMCIYPTNLHLLNYFELQGAEACF